MITSAVLAALDLLLLRQRDDGWFQRVSPPPAWALPLLPPAPGQPTDADGAALLSPAWLVDTFPFLESFWSEAAEAWSDPQVGRRESASFCAVGPDGNEILLVASALRIDDQRLLLLDGNQPRLHEQARLLQLARQAHLVHQRLERDVLRRDILFHSIVHDLTSQLSSLRGVLQLLQADCDSPAEAELLATGLRAAAKQESLIHDILDVFRSESASEEQPRSVLPTCDLWACIEETVKLLRPSATWRRVRLISLRSDEESPGPQVQAEPQRLERVLSNLLENALRHAPRDSAIAVTLSQRAGQALVTVDDDGPGVPAELGATLFAKFARARTSGGKTGLGLYFCRLTIERWGGQIGYEPRAPRGARFWFSLPTAGC